MVGQYDPSILQRRGHPTNGKVSLNKNIIIKFSINDCIKLYIKIYYLKVKIKYKIYYTFH